MVLGGFARGAAGGQTSPYGAPPQQGYGYPQGGYPPSGYAGAPPQAPPMTLDDVVVRTVGLLSLMVAVAAASWVLLPPATLGVALFGSMIAGFILVLAISFMRITNPFVIGAYAVVEGVFVGVISKFFESFFSGIVLQAAVGTVAVFFGMAALYKFRVIRATPMFRKVVIGALIGAVALMLLNLVMRMFGTDIGLFGNPTDGKVEVLPIIIAFALVVLAALTFVLDFDMVEQGARYGLERRFAWYCAFGIVVGLVFLYVQLLQLLSLLRE